MIYRGMKLKAQDYFDETETYLNRCFGNAIEPYDVMNGFARVGLTESTKNMLKGYKPSGYVSDTLNTQETAMLGYLAMGMPEATGRKKWNYNDSYDDFEELEDDEKEKIQKYENAANELEDNYRRQLCVSRLFQASTDVDITPLTAKQLGIGKEMEKAYEYTAEAVMSKDYETIAKICEQGLRHLQRGVDTYLDADILDLYADCYVCDGILKLIEKNEKIREKVNIPEEQMTYYQGLRKLKTIMENGEKAKEQLESPETISENERTKLNQYVKQYTDLQIMLKLNYVNEYEGGSKKCDYLKEIRDDFNLDIDQNLDMELVHTSYQVEANPFVKQLGGMEPDEFLDDISKQADRIRQTGMYSGFEELEDVGEEFQNVEKKIKRSEQSAEILENTEKLLKEREQLEKERKALESKKGGNKQENTIERDKNILAKVRQAEQKILKESKYLEDEQGLYCKNMYDWSHDDFIDGMWKSANTWKIDNFLQGSSKEFKAVRESLKKIREYKETQGRKKNIADYKVFMELIDDLQKTTEKYLNNKDGSRDVKEQRKRRPENSYANRRYNFVLGVESYAKEIRRRENEMQQKAAESAIFRRTAAYLYEKPEYEQYTNTEEDGTIQKDKKNENMEVFKMAVGMTMLQEGNKTVLQKLKESYQTDQPKIQEFANLINDNVKTRVDEMFRQLKKGTLNMNTLRSNYEQKVEMLERQRKSEKTVSSATNKEKEKHAPERVM